MPSAKRQNLKIALLLAGAALIASAYALSHPLRDFVEYWTAAHLVLAQKNPYSVPDMLHAQTMLGWREAMPLIPLNPPWTLLFIAPLGLADSYSLAWLGWLAVMIAAMAVSSRLLMDMYFGDIKIPDISDSVGYRCLFGFTFFPTLLCLGLCQLTPLLLLGVVGFLHFECKGKPMWAGLFLSLTVIKPQLVYLLWLAVLLESFRQRRWKTIASIALVVSGLALSTLVLDRHAYSQYWELARGYYPHLYASGMTAILRRAFEGHDTFWVQFVPPLGGLVWFAFYWRRHRNNWNWFERMPTLVTASLLTTAWGFLFDQVLLVIPLIALAGIHSRGIDRLPWNLVIWYTGLNCALILLMAVPPLVFIPAPVLLAVRLYRDARRQPSPILQLRTEQCL